MDQSVYQDQFTQICIEQSCPEKGSIIIESQKLKKSYVHFKHQRISKLEVMQRIKYLKCNYYAQNSKRNQVYDRLNRMSENITEVVHFYQDKMIDLQDKVQTYFEFVQSSYEKSQYEEAKEKITAKFDYLNVVSVLKKADKFQEICYPYQAYPLDQIEKVQSVLDQLCKTTKMELENILSHFLQECQEKIKLDDFLKVKVSGETKFSKYLKSKVYETFEDEKVLKRIEKAGDFGKSLTTSSVIGTQIGAIALVQRELNQDCPSIKFKVRKGKSFSLLVGVCNIDIAKQNDFTNCVIKGYYMADFGKLFQFCGSKNQSSSSIKAANKTFSVEWGFKEGDEINMRLLKNKLEFSKKGIVFNYHATLKINPEDMQNLHPAIQLSGDDAQIEILD